MELIKKLTLDADETEEAIVEYLDKRGFTIKEIEGISKNGVTVTLK